MLQPEDLEAERGAGRKPGALRGPAAAPAHSCDEQAGLPRPPEPAAAAAASTGRAVQTPGSGLKGSDSKPRLCDLPKARGAARVTPGMETQIFLSSRQATAVPPDPVLFLSSLLTLSA